jgi:ABC-type sugar transport system ATPase subunit
MLKINLNKFSYLNDTILENIDFKIEKGTQLSLIGESGCGKSSLLKIIYGL